MRLYMEEITEMMILGTEMRNGEADVYREGNTDDANNVDLHR